MADIKKFIRKISRCIFVKIVPESRILFEENVDWTAVRTNDWSLDVSKKARLYSPYTIFESKVDDFTYIARNAIISKTQIGKFCSIGPNFLCGWGIHPTNGISTSPMFYSTMEQNGVSLTKETKITERSPIIIGNDVFIGANVVVLDGVTIGDGAIIGAGAVVSKNIPPYAIAVGCPINIIKYRMTEVQREAMKKIKWWNFDETKLQEVEHYFFNIDEFIDKYS